MTVNTCQAKCKPSPGTNSQLDKFCSSQTSRQLLDKIAVVNNPTKPLRNTAASIIGNDVISLL